MAIKLNDALAKQVGNWQDDNGEIKLPFDAPVLWVLNGSAQYKPLVKESPALYFGGWATDSETLESMDKIPNGMVKHEFVPKGGQPISVYSARQVAVAVFGKRMSSVDKESGVRYPGYHKNASPHLQVLAILAERDANKNYIPLYPVVLSAKGYQVGHINDALSDWSAKTNKARREFASGIRSELFWCWLGTFGNEPNYKNVGSGSKTSPITPVSCFIPENIDEKMVERMFVGERVAEEMDLYRQQADAWLGAWKNKSGGNGSSPVEETGFDRVPEDPPDEDFS